MVDNVQSTPSVSNPATMTDAERKAEYERFVREKGVERIASNVTSATFKPMVERTIEPMSFEAITADMQKFRVRVIVMTYAQVADYVGFAHELYIEETPTVGKPFVPLEQKWQRKLDSKRVNDAIEYLKTENHYFPAIVCVPTTEDSCVFEDGKVVIKATGILTLDGQHRVDALHKALKDNPDIADECVCIQILELMKIDDRRQVFADINRTPRKVARSLNLVFDNVDRVARLAKQIIHQPVTTVSDGKEYTNYPLKGLFDMERATPLPKSQQLMSLTNLYDLLKPLMAVVDDNKEPVLSDEQLFQTVDAIVDHMPDIDRLRKGNDSFGMLKKEYIYSATLWKALGQALAAKLQAKNEAGESRYPASEFAGYSGNWVNSITNAGNWKLTAKIWADPNRRVVTDGKKIGTQKGDIANAVAILRDQMN